MEGFEATTIGTSSINCSATTVPNGTICMEDPNDMLKPWKSHPLFIEIITINVLVFVSGVVGNIVVIVGMLGDLKSRSATNYFLVSLAIGDLLMLCVYGPLETYTHFVVKWDEGGTICRTAKFAELVSATSSVLNLMAVTIERFIVIVFPIKSQTFCTVNNIVKAVVSVWVISVLLAVPVLFTTTTYRLTFTNNVTSLTLNYCTRSGDSPNFFVYQFIVIFCIPGITMTVCYSYVIRELWLSTKKMNLLTSGINVPRRETRAAVRFQECDPEAGEEETVECSVGTRVRYFFQRKSNRRDVVEVTTETVGCSRRGKTRREATSSKDEANAARRQVIKMLILVVVLFYICWGPRVTMDLLQKFNIFDFDDSTYRARITVNLLTFFHGCINPFIYSFMSRNFRTRLSRFLERCGCKKKTGPGVGRQQPSAVSRPRSTSSRVEREVKTSEIKLQTRGSFISGETKVTEIESAAGPQPSTSAPAYAESSF